MKKATLLWIDLEMTGLVPGKDKILEVAALATDWDLTELASLTAVVKVDEEIIKNRMVGEFWEKNQESRDGLIAQIATGQTTKEVENLLLTVLDDHFEKQSI